MKCRFRIKKCLAVLSAIALSGIVLHVALKFIPVNFVLEKKSNGLIERVTPNKSEKQQKSNFDTTGNTLKKRVTPSIQKLTNQTDEGVTIPQTKSLSEAQDPSLDMELYLRMTTVKKHLPSMYESILVQSMKYFWPENFSMVVVLDNDRKPDHEFGDAIRKAFPFPRVCYMNDTQIVQFSGPYRMQRDMFYPEVCTTKKYVAFIDTDTMFITRIIPKMLFHNGKPIVVGIYGNVWDHHYTLIAMSTVNIFKTKEVMRCMSNFPVIMKVKHLIELRKYVENLHNMTFEEVLLTRRATHFSQFNMMCQFIWTFHRDEYEFRLQFQRNKRVMLKSASLREDATYFNNRLTDEQTRPFARVAVHYKYIVFANWLLQTTWTYLIKESICYAGGFELCPEVCKQYDKNKIRPEMFIFERIGWAWDKRCLSSQREHYKQVAAYNSPWYSDILKGACNEVDTLKWKL